MPINCRCPHCRQPMAIPDGAAGKPVKCPKCNGISQVPGRTQEQRRHDELVRAVQTSHDRVPNWILYVVLFFVLMFAGWVAVIEHSKPGGLLYFPPPTSRSQR